MLQQAAVSHRTADRLRIKITERRGDEEFFSALAQDLKDKFAYRAVTTNPLTGSVLILDPKIDIDAVSRFASENGYFELDTGTSVKPKAAHALVVPVRQVHRKIRDFSGGEVGLNELIFITLCLFGLYEILRGNAKSPPWYTAFWYAFGIFTKSIVERSDTSA
jgi:hypothetical protein